MRVIMVMFDSLNRHMLPAYGCNDIIAPNFKRLQERTMTFDQCYVGSMPCMPTRRELHTGRHNFLHRSWGPIEPFDDSMPEILKKNGIYSHLVTDHHHYWHEGGSTYHTKYSTFDLVRGQEADPWKAEVEQPIMTDYINARPQDIINRKYIKTIEDHFQTRVFNGGLEFLDKNHLQNNWFLQIESFDPHEPFFSHPTFNALYPDGYDAMNFDWPIYHEVTETQEQIEHLINQYKALLTMCDSNLGKVLDFMDQHQMWNDTMLIVNTDHGFLLGDHHWWGKKYPPLYTELSHIPLFIWDPRSKKQNCRSKQIVQPTDLAPTILDFFNLEVPQDMQGKILKPVISNDQSVRKYALFGYFGMHVNVTDGRYIYFRGALNKNNEPLFNYTLMPMHMAHTFSVEELRSATFADPFPFTKGCKVLKVPSSDGKHHLLFGTLLYDLKKDPEQKCPITDEKIEELMIKNLVELMKENDAPIDQFIRLGLESYL